MRSTLPVPYIQAWTDEHVQHQLAFEWSEEVRGLRLTYPDALPQDWMFGALWARHGQARTGRPEWKVGSINTVRQRRCMLHGLCQVCEQPAFDPHIERTWWLFPSPEHPFIRPGGVTITHIAPTCKPCITLSQRICPRLRRGSTVHTTSGYEEFGVLADLYTPTTGRQADSVDRDVTVELDRFRALSYALAKQLIVRFNDLQPATP